MYILILIYKILSILSKQSKLRVVDVVLAMKAFIIEVCFFSVLCYVLVFDGRILSNSLFKIILYIRKKR